MGKPRIPPILISVTLIILALALAYGLYASLVYALKTKHPIGYVVGTSMLPTLQPGDLVVIVGVEAEDIIVGDIIVFQPPYRSEPIIHRVIAVEKIGGNIYITTKGDNNRVSLPDEIRFPASYVIGRVVYRVPYIGWILYFIQAPVVTISGIGEIKLGFILIVVLSLIYIIQDMVARRRTERYKEAEDVCENTGLQL